MENADWKAVRNHIAFRAEKCLGAIAWGKTEADVYIMRDSCNLLHDTRTKPKLSEDSMVKQCIWPGCDYYFLNKSYAIRHLLLKHIKWPTSCHRCREPMAQDIASHLCLQNCSVCNLECVSIQTMAQHVYATHATFFCQLCEQNFSDLSGMKNHIMMENKVLSKTCIICRFSIPNGDTSPFLMYEHILKHHGPAGKKMYLTANKIINFDTKPIPKSTEESTLKPVSRVISRSKPLKHETYQFDSFKCPHCNKLFSARSGLKIHGGIAHRKEAIVFCPRCPQTFPSVVNCKKHLKEFHSKKGKRQNARAESEPFLQQKHRSIVPTNVPVDGNHNPDSKDGMDNDEMECYEEVDDNISDDNYENDENEDISKEACDLKREELNDLDFDNGLFDNTENANSQTIKTESEDITIEDNMENILEEVKIEPEREQNHKRESNKEHDNKRVPEREQDEEQGPATKKRKKPMPGLLKISSLSRESSVSPVKEVSNPLLTSMLTTNVASSQAGVQVGNIREKILPTSFKNILPKEQIKSEAQLVVRPDGKLLLNSRYAVKKQVHQDVTSKSMTPQVVSATSLNPILFPQQTNSKQSVHPAGFEIQTSHGIIKVVPQLQGQLMSNQQPGFKLVSSSGHQQPVLGSAVSPPKQLITSTSSSMVPGIPSSGIKRIPSGQIQVRSGASLLTPAGAQILQSGQFQFSGGRLIPVQVSTAGIQVSTASRQVFTSGGLVSSSDGLDIKTENTQTTPKIVLIKKDKLVKSEGNAARSSSVSTRLISKHGGSRQSLLKKNFPEATSSINKDAIVVSDDELEAPSVAVAVPGVHIKRTIMVDKVALNLPVVMTKRNNAKMVQDNPCLEIFMKNKSVWGKCRICEQQKSTNQISEPLTNKENLEMHFRVIHDLNLIVERRKLYFEMKFDVDNCKYKKCFLCSYCGKEFTTKFNVRRHQMLYCPRKDEIDPLLLGLRPGNLEKRNLVAGYNEVDPDVDLDEIILPVEDDLILEQVTAKDSDDDTEENALEINEDPLEEVETIETTTDNIGMACQEVLQDDQPSGDDVVKEAMAQLDRIEKDIGMQVRKSKY